MLFGQLFCLELQLNKLFIFFTIAFSLSRFAKLSIREVVDSKLSIRSCRFAKLSIREVVDSRFAKLSIREVVRELRRTIGNVYTNLIKIMHLLIYSA